MYTRLPDEYKNNRSSPYRVGKIFWQIHIKYR